VRLIFALIALILSISSASSAPSDGMENLSISKQIEVLQQQNDASPKRIALLQEKLAQTLQAAESIQPISVAGGQVQREIAGAEVRRLQEALQDNLQSRSDTEMKIHHLQELYQKWQVSKLSREVVKQKLASLQERLMGLNDRLNLQDLYTKTLKTSLENAKLAAQIYEDYNGELHKAQELLLQKHRISRLQTLTQHSQEQQQQWIQELQKQIKITTNNDESLAHKIDAQSRIFYLQERIKLSKIVISYNHLQENLTDLFSQGPTESSLQVLETEIPQVKAAVSELTTMMEKVNNKDDLISEHRAIVKRSLEQQLITADEAKVINQLLTELETIQTDLMQSLTKLQKRILAYHTSLQDQLAQSLTLRNGLPGLNLYAWLSIASHFLDFPTSGAQFVDSLTNTIINAVTQLHALEQFLLVFAETGWLLLALGIRYLLSGFVKALSTKRSRSTINALYIAAQLLSRNYLAITGLIGFLILVRLTSIPFKFYSTVIYLTLVWFAFHALIGLSRLVLLERVSDASGRDVRLYYRLKWTLVCGGMITGATVLAHQLFLHYTVLNVMNRLLMLFLLAVALVLLRGRDVVPTLMAPYIDQRRIYLHHAVTLLSWLIPLSLLTNALVGLIGYVDMAKTMGYYQLVFVISITLYVITRGLFIDSLDILSEWAIRHLRNGWLLTEALLKPLDRIIRITLLSLMVIGTLMFMGVTRQTVWLGYLFSIVNFPIFKFSGGNITIWSSVAFFVIGSFVLWMGRWSRELAYRWLFRNEDDIAARKSFSAFVQYAVVAIGSLLSLRVLGIDFTGMAMILGGLAVGLGLGLRDFVNNIVCGIMMLIERPVREGDLISLDNFEGEVTHIGIRSMRIRSWDHMEVMIPNSEAFNKTFTNWTLQDSIVRTVVKIKVHRDDDAEAVKRLLEEAIVNIDEVLADPEPQVLLLEISDALIEFEVRYFINLQHHSRVVIRSVVLLVLHAKLKAAGIMPPYAPQELYLKST